MPRAPSPTPSTLPTEPQRSPWLHHNITTLDNEDNPMAINSIQYQFWHDYPTHLNVTLLHQPIDNIPSAIHYTSTVIPPETGKTITRYEKLSMNTWQKKHGQKKWPWNWATLLKVTKQPTQGTNFVFLLDCNAIKNIPADKKITHAAIAVVYRPQKPDPNGVRTTDGGILIENPQSTWSNHINSRPFHCQNTLKQCC